MTCDDIEARLDPWLKGLLRVGVRAGFEIHVSACGPCRALADGVREDDRLLGDWARAGRPEREAFLDRASRTAARPGRRPWAWASAAAVLIAAFWIWRPGHPPPAAVASLARATASVEVLDTGRGEAVPPGGPLRLRPGARVRTPTGARALFTCADGTEICLNEASEAAFLGDRHLEVARGEVWTLVASFDRPMRIDVAAGAVTPLGCVLDVSVIPSESRLTTISGTALFSDLKGGSRTVRTGNTCAIREGRIGGLETALGLPSRTAWIEDLRAPAEPEANDEAERELRFLESPESRRDPAARDASALRLRDLAHPRCIGGLIGLLADESPEVRACAAQALDRVAAWGHPPSLSTEAWRTLEGKALEQAYCPWQKWWANRHPSRAERK